MYYHLSNHIYITQFRDEFILLDTKKDKYTICFKQFSNFFSHLLDEDNSRTKLLSSSDPSSSEDLIYIQKLLEDNIIETKNSPYPFQIDRKLTSDGVANVDWRLPLENKNINNNIHVLEALYALVKVNFYMQFRGLYKTICLIKKKHDSQIDYTIPSDEELKKLVNIVNKACLLYPTRTKCLEWAMTYVLLALKRRWKCNLEIGVQNYPFFAHAWVECDGKIVMDSQDLRKGLAVILNEPFRRLKK